MQPIKALRVLCEPRTVFLSAAGEGGPRMLFALTAIELVLTHPKTVIGACLRAPGAPLIAVMTLAQALLHAVSGPLFLLLVVATAYNIAARMRGRGADLWAVLGALSYAWVPHTLGVALLACLYRAQLPTPEHPETGLLMLAPTLYGAMALVCLWQQGSLQTQATKMAPPKPWARAATIGVGCAFVVAFLVTCRHVQTRWGDMRPKLAGDALPAFTLEGVNASRLQSATLTGHVTLVDFWATWCGPCMKAMPELERLHRSYSAQGLRIVAVNIEANNRVGIQSFIDTQQLTLPIYEDTTHLADAMHVHVYPTSFLVDAKGRIIHVYSGPADAADLEDRIVMLLGRDDNSPNQ